MMKNLPTFFLGFAAFCGGAMQLNAATPVRKTYFECTVRYINSGVNPNDFSVGDTVVLDLNDVDYIFPSITKPDGTYSEWGSRVHPLFQIDGVKPENFQITLSGDIVSGEFHESNKIEIEHDQPTGYATAWITLAIDYGANHKTLIRMLTDCRSR